MRNLLHIWKSEYMSLHINERGFTKIELILGVIILGMYINLALPGLTANMDTEREAQVKADIHIIQMAIERYYVDHETYPRFLLGGDQKGWREWHLRNDESPFIPDIPSNNIVVDVLLQYGYLDSYPKNPFVDDGMTIIKSTSAFGSGPIRNHRFGDGDPRFGYRGDRMGNGLSDPEYYKHRTYGIPPVETSLIETRRTLDDETVRRLGFIEPPDGIHYMMGGRKAFDNQGNVITIATFWPGNFFYRSIWVRPANEPRGWGGDYCNATIPGGAKPNNYILGGYGSTRTAGMDVIRLEGRNWDNTDDVFFRLPAPWFQYARSSGIKCGYDIESETLFINGSKLPEVFGGGDAFTGPMYPPNRPCIENNYTYDVCVFGAPDGHPDGVIVLFHNE